jgi:hypothetical protein
VFIPTALQVKQFLADVPIQLPIDVLLALPDYVTRDVAAPRFNLLAVMGRLLGRAGWERASKVINPRIWSPGWDELELQQFATSAFLDRPGFLEKVWTESLRATEFPGILPEADPQYFDIVHFTGQVHNGYKGPVLVLSDKNEQAVRPGRLRESLVASQTRLLILQVPRWQLDDAANLAEAVTGGSGPAVLVVTGRDAGIVDTYLLNLYANIIHNMPLLLLAQPEQWMIYAQPLSKEDVQPGPIERGLSVRLFHGTGGADLLRFDNYVNALKEKLRTARRTSVEKRTNLSKILSERETYLHSAQVDDLRRAIDETLEHEDIITNEETKLSQIGWHRESEGVVPTSEAKDSVDVITENARRYDAMESDLSGDAPRVLNANFFDPNQKRFLDRDEGLRADREYDFLVDIGPVWDKSESIVAGNAEFPEKALPQEGEGYLVEAVLVSDDFRPRVASALMWVPRGGGRSFPYRNGKRDETSAPVALRVCMPSLPGESGENSIEARARLCIYYENNLLQSGIVRVGVIRDKDDVRLSVKNAIEMDFALTGSFQNLNARYAKRQIVSVPGAKAEELPVTLNLALNDDGAGNHRILIKEQKELTAWTNYDPKDARDTLDDVRKALKECFFKKNEDDGEVTAEIGLNEGTIGQTKRQFLWDLYRLAIKGRDLWDKAFGGAIFDNADMVRAEWEAALRAALDKGGVIQIARTGPANYAYPWALLYEYPLSTIKKENRFCQIVDEWSDDGIRRRPEGRKAEDWPGKACPYSNRESHQENIFCPYGFWGLKQIIEQPLSALRNLNGSLQPGDTPDDLHFGSNLDMAVGVTDDLPPSERDNHLRRLGAIKPIRFKPQLPADDFYKVRDMLRAPLVVYFLCHGEYDRDKRRPYLSIGKRDNEDVHKIYPNTLQNWASGQHLDIQEWKKRRPLIFINGCHTADLVPGEVLNFVTPFSDSGASGVIGTEINILLPVAAEISESLFRKFSAGVSIGEALQQIRWELANKGNLLGLAYTIYCLASLRAVSDG